MIEQGTTKILLFSLNESGWSSARNVLAMYSWRNALPFLLPKHCTTVTDHATVWNMCRLNQSMWRAQHRTVVTKNINNPSLYTKDWQNGGTTTAFLPEKEHAPTIDSLTRTASLSVSTRGCCFYQTLLCWFTSFAFSSDQPCSKCNWAAKNFPLHGS
jgi:hypothetical protein